MRKICRGGNGPILATFHLKNDLRVSLNHGQRNRYCSLVLVFFIIHVVGSSFVLEGSQTSYAQFRQWDGGLNSSIEFEFKTSQNNGLLLYTDNPVEKEYLMIKIVDGSVRLR